MIAPAAKTRNSPAGPQSAVTRRAILIGLFLVPLNVWWVLVAELRWYVILTLNPLFVTPIFLLFALVCVNAVMRRLAPRLLLRPGELVTIYVMLVISCTIATHDFIINLMSTLGWPTWMANTQNEWQRMLWPTLPRHLYVWDKSVLQGYFYGASSLYDPHVLKAWLGPLAMWSIFIFDIGWMMMCMTVIVRKSWMDETRLSFPIIRLPLALTGESTHAGMLGNKVFWYGVLIPVIFGLINGLNVWFPSIPPMKLRATYLPITLPPWSAAGPITVAYYPFGIALAFLIPLDVSFSMWFFYFFFKAQAVTGYQLGFGNVPNMPFVQDQEIGGWFAYAISLIYLYRRQFKGIFAGAFKPGGADRAGEPMSCRAAVFGFFGTSGVFLAFWMFAGMSLIWAFASLISYVFISIAITRIRAESGGQHNIWDPEPQNLMRLFDSADIGGHTLGAGATSHWFWRLNRCHLMPNIFESFKLAQEHKMRFRDLLLPMGLAFVVASVTGMWSCLQLFYSEGALSKMEGFALWTNLEAFGWLENSLRVGFRPELARWTAVGSGVSVVTLLAFLRTQFPWWPLHPLGFCMGAEMRWLWMPLLIGWLAKATIIRIGGLSLYRRALPFFLGVLLGDYSVGAVWSLIGVIFHVPVLQIFH